MADTIQGIFVHPPIAIARLGGSTTPQDAYRWVEAPNPRSKGETTIEPDWSLVVQSDATVDPVMPDFLSFRDGALIRPVCPFFEVWALLGQAGSDPSTWKEAPLTPDLLATSGASPSDLVFAVDAKNFKAARRTGNAELRYGTFPPLQVKGDNHAPAPIFAASPPGVPASRRMIPTGQTIPLGAFQVLKSRPQPAPAVALGWTQLVEGRPLVNVEVVRARLTPARGHSYGPPSAADPQKLPGNLSFAPVDQSRAFLNAAAGWANANIANSAPDAPQDTYDGADAGNNRSLGVVDDTCEARIAVSLSLPAPARVLTASACVFVGPPDFAPDRRPFLSLADELNDRAGDSHERTALLSESERDTWVEDLFERIYETMSLLNVDFWRREKALILTGSRLAPVPIANDKTREPSRAMSGRDALRNRSFALPDVSTDIKLPLTQHARDRHRALSGLEALRDFVNQNRGRLGALIRRPFEAEQKETSDGIGTTTMRMPPFMRNSNAGPLTLAAWQYDLVMAWVQAIETQPLPAAALAATARPRRISDAAVQRREQVLTRLARTRRLRPAQDQ